MSGRIYGCVSEKKNLKNLKKIKKCEKSKENKCHFFLSDSWIKMDYQTRMKPPKDED